MFGLGGVSGYLFRPLAKAVVFALCFSYLLSRTLVNTLARYLLAAQAAHRHGDEHLAGTPRSGNPIVRFQRAFEHRFENFRGGYRRLLELSLKRRRVFIAGFLLAVFASFALVPFLGQNFFPAITSDQIKLHVRAQTGTRIEETSALCDKIEDSIRTLLPGGVASIVDNIGLPISGINMAYANSGSISAADADILISLNPKEAEKSGRAVEELREQLPKMYPGTRFAFLPADMVSQILNFGLPAPIDVQVIGHDVDADRKYADMIFSRIAKVSGVADARIQQQFDYPTLYVDVNRSLADLTGLTEKDIAYSVQDTLAGSVQSAPTFWLNPKNGVSYPIVVQSPQYWQDSLGDLADVPVTATNASQLLGGIATIRRGMSSAVVSHYNVQPVVDIYATTHKRDLGAVATDIQKILNATAKQAPPGSTVVLRGQVSTMREAYAQLFGGLALAIVFIYLLIVVNFQSWLDPFVIVSALPAALAGIVWMLFATFTTLSVPALTGAILCMGVATANSILVISFAREKLAEGADAAAAALDAGVTRFRPVLMTALAMIFGMLPMALSAEQNAPLGRAVIGGLICATCATLVFVPVLFAVVHGRNPAQSEPPYAPDGSPLESAAPHA
jgi:multidrug efflux pump subunit AcrB